MSGFEGPVRTLVITICGLAAVFGAVTWCIYLFKRKGTLYARLGLPCIVGLSVARVGESVAHWGTPVGWFNYLSVPCWLGLGLVIAAMYKDALKAKTVRGD